MISEVISRCLANHKKFKNKKILMPLTIQIEAVNSLDNPKSGFLFDLCAIELDFLKLILTQLKREELISNDLRVVTFEDETFIINVKKVLNNELKLIVDINGDLKHPLILEDKLEIKKAVKTVHENLLKGAENISLNSPIKYLSPTIFGYLINYPILYYCKSDENCLSDKELNVFKIYKETHLLMSFSIPSQIYNENEEIKNTLNMFVSQFNSHYHVELITTTQSRVIL